MTTAKGSVHGPHNVHHTVFYGLSTCVWCKRTRQFLENEGVQFNYVYVDLLPASERREVIQRIRQWNPQASFPTIVVDNSQHVVGYDTEKLKEVLGL